jgi:hypothetical protein
MAVTAATSHAVHKPTPAKPTTTHTKHASLTAPLTGKKQQAASGKSGHRVNKLV